MESQDIQVGSVVYRVGRFYDDGQFHICRTKVTDRVVTKTKTGRERPPVFKGKPLDYSLPNTGDGEFDLYPFENSATATEAVNNALKHYFDEKKGNDAPEVRLLKAVFGQEHNPQIVATELVQVIKDLKNFHALFAEAFAEDDKIVQEL